jgi:hypothetical protein
LIGGDWPALVSAAVDHAVAEAKEYTDESFGLKLIRDCIQIIKRRGRIIDGELHLQSSVLRDELVAIEDAPWLHYKNDKPISPRSIAIMLKPYRIVPRKCNDGNYWRLSVFETAFFAFARDEDSSGHPEQVPPSSTPPQTESNQEVAEWNKAASSLHVNDAHPPRSENSREWRDEWNDSGGCDEGVTSCNKTKNGTMELGGACPAGEQETSDAKTLKTKDAEVATTGLSGRIEI